MISEEATGRLVQPRDVDGLGQRGCGYEQKRLNWLALVTDVGEQRSLQRGLTAYQSCKGPPAPPPRLSTPPDCCPPADPPTLTHVRDTDAAATAAGGHTSETTKCV